MNKQCKEAMEYMNLPKNKQKDEKQRELCKAALQARACSKSCGVSRSATTA
jgi:hypothetical protein